MKYDVIVVGSGYAGSVTAHKFAKDGKKVLIIERRTISVVICMITLMKMVLTIINMDLIFSIQIVIM